MAHRGQILIALLLPVVALLGMAGQIAGAPPATPTANDRVRLRGAVAAVLAPDSGRRVPRLTSVDIDSTGDATIVIALRAGDTEREIVEGGESDFLAVFRAAYHPAPVASVRTTTVIGTYPVTGQYSTREWPVLRAVLTHQTADRIDWYHLTASSRQRSTPGGSTRRSWRRRPSLALHRRHPPHRYAPDISGANSTRDGSLP